MKHLNKLLFIVLIMAGLTSHAQDSNNPWAISIGVNAIDTKASAGGNNGFLDNHFSNIFRVKQNWDIIPSVSYLSVSRYVGNNFTFGVQGSVNKMTKFVTYNSSSDTYTTSSVNDLAFYAVDGKVSYSFMKLIKSKIIDPSLSIGGGYTFLGKSSYGTLNAGAGLTFWFTENIGLSFASVYHSQDLFDVDRANFSGVPDAPGYYQHTLGITFKFGGRDSDGDGIYDKHDDCPDVKGLKKFNGCPDTDGDGIVDGKDACPDAAGKEDMNGCPDTDGDGIADKDDACPNASGTKALKGCPDTDGDGIVDKDDKCPKVKGPKDNSGCPWPDTDKDGVLDKDDECPSVAGPASNKGCPEVTPEALEQLKMQARYVYFNSNKSTFKDVDVPQRLDAMAAILKNYPNAKFSIEGHTDSDGSDVANQTLSEQRANAVRDALISRGISESKLSVIGYGETKPVATNATAAGKAQNRRTEVILVK